MEKQARTLAFESASRRAPLAEAPAGALAEAPTGRDRSFREAALPPPGATPEHDEEAPRAGRRDLDRRADQVENEHARSMILAVGLCLVSGGILASYGHVPNTLAALAIALFAAGIVLQHRAHRRLRVALIDRAVRQGVSPREAESRVDAALDRRLG